MAKASRKQNKQENQTNVLGSSLSLNMALTQVVSDIYTCVYIYVLERLVASQQLLYGSLIQY